MWAEASRLAPHQTQYRILFLFPQSRTALLHAEHLKVLRLMLCIIHYLSKQSCCDRAARSQVVAVHRVILKSIGKTVSQFPDALMPAGSRLEETTAMTSRQVSEALLHVTSTVFTTGNELRLRSLVAFHRPRTRTKSCASFS